MVREALIRPLSAPELPELAALAKQFYASSRFLRDFDIAKFEAFWAGLIASGAGVIFILQKDDVIAGTIGGLAYAEPYSGELLAQEFFWFVDEAQRGQGIRLYCRFEEWAREKGCAEVRMGHLADSMPEKVAVFYERVGFTKVETLYAKRLRDE